jgi:hypothetical protein
VCSSFLEACASYSAIVKVFATNGLPDGAGTFKGPRPSLIADGGLATRFVPYLGVYTFI